MQNHFFLPVVLTVGGAILLMNCPSGFSAVPDQTASHALAVEAVNSLGWDLLQLELKKKPPQNTLLSPYSIATAMSIASAGASGETLAEMRRVLHHGESDEKLLHESFHSLFKALGQSVEQSRSSVSRSVNHGGPSDPVSFSVANRLFVEQSRPMLPDFESFVMAYHGAAPEAFNFRTAPEPSRQKINEWVAKETFDRIRDLIPPQGITNDTALVIANAIHFKGSWESPFTDNQTRPRTFYLPDQGTAEVPFMHNTLHASFQRVNGNILIALPYVGRDFFFVILMPESATDQRAEPDFNAMAEASMQRAIEIRLSMPKFRIEPPTIALGSAFRELGLKKAFDIPQGSADFSRISPRKPNDYLYISEIFHKTFLELDEAGTEAAAATAVAMIRATMMPVEPPPAVVIDRPFFFGILHRPSGLWLFVGELADPR